MDNYNEICRLVLWERQSRVRYLAQELLSCFFSDATVTTSWTAGSAKAYVSGAQARQPDPGRPILNRLGPPVVHEKGSRAIVELPSTTTRLIEVNGVQAVLESFMRLIYRVQCREGVWKIADLTAINEFDTLRPAVDGMNLNINPEDLEGLRISYRFLSYVDRQLGREPSQDLFGIDRPKDVDRLYEAAFAWRDSQQEETV